MKKYYVYTLAYPDGTVFYIGKGTGDRIHEHERYAALSDEMMKYYYRNREKCQVIREIWAQGGEVQKSILYETDVELDAYIYEWALINMIYHDTRLTNSNVSGRHKLSTPKSDYSRPDPPAKVPHNPLGYSGILESNGRTYYTVSMAARYLGISQNSFYRNVRSKIQIYKHGALKRDYFLLSDLDKYTRVADGETYHTASEAARYLNIARDTFNRNVKDKIPVYHLGALRREYYRQSDLDRYRGARPAEEDKQS